MTTLTTYAVKGSGLTNAEIDANFNDLNSTKIETSAKDTTGGVPGLTLFKINIRNAANTFTNFFTNTTTAARTWIFPDVDGTVAMVANITGGALAGSFTTITAASVGSSIAIESLTAPSLVNSWANSGGANLVAGYWKDSFGVVRCQGKITGGSSGTTAFTLPAGYRPTATTECVLVGGSCTVTSAGVVTITGTTVNLSGITFRTT